MKTLLSLDLSTTCTGWAIFNIETKELLHYGTIKSTAKKINKLTYPTKQLLKIRNICVQILPLVIQYNPDAIVIEEINRHKSRMSGKTLDSLHAILWDKLYEIHNLDKVKYIDSDGLNGWRTLLSLRLSESDKVKNKERKKTNKKIKKGVKKLPIINKKHLACRYVNAKYKTNFDVDANATDNDVVDAIGIGSAILTYWRL